MKLFLDDERKAPEDWIRCKTILELIGYIKFFPEDVSEISLDHDLGEDALTGYDFCKWLERETWNKPKLNIVFHIHSQNPVGRENMKRVLKHLGYAQ